LDTKVTKFMLTNPYQPASLGAQFNRSDLNAGGNGQNHFQHVFNICTRAGKALAISSNKHLNKEQFVTSFLRASMWAFSLSRFLRVVVVDQGLCFQSGSARLLALRSVPCVSATGSAATPVNFAFQN
jgi:hypothetical protein